MKARSYFLPRLLALLLTFGILFTLTWYLVVFEHAPIVTVPEHVKPLNPKTNQELLVGTWRFVNNNGFVLPEDYIITVEYTSNGELIIRKSFPNLPTKRDGVTIGTYVLNGMNLSISTPDPDVAKGIRIETISEVEMRIVSIVGDQQEIGIFRKQVK